MYVVILYVCCYFTHLSGPSECDFINLHMLGEGRSCSRSITGYYIHNAWWEASLNIIKFTFYLY